MIFTHMANYFRNENFKNFKGSKESLLDKKNNNKTITINILCLVYSNTFILLKKTYSCKHLIKILKFSFRK